MLPWERETIQIQLTEISRNYPAAYPAYTGKGLQLMWSDLIAGSAVILSTPLTAVLDISDLNKPELPNERSSL